MKKGGIAIVTAVLLMLAITSTARAEDLIATVPLTTAAEINPPAPLPGGASGTTYLRVNINRDANGNITGAVVQFLTYFRFPGSVTIRGHHIHEAVATANGPIVIDPPLAGVTTDFPTGVGKVNLTVPVTNTAVLARLLANPAGFYVNLHTSANPAGALRGQLTRLSETIANSVEMNLASEVPMPTTQFGIGTGTITINVRRNALGEVIGGAVTFTVNFDFIGEVRFNGLHIHEEVAGVNGPVRINTGINNTTNLFIAPTGKGTINIPVEITATTLPAFRRLLANPTGFYINIHTTVFPGGVIRAQLTEFVVPPALQQASDYVLTAGGPVASVTFSGFGFDEGTVILMNDQLAMTSFNPATGGLTAVVPPLVQAGAGPIFAQARQSDGTRSLPLIIQVATTANQNTVAAATTDAARYQLVVAAEAIASTFGTNLSNNTVAASTPTLPTTLDGSSLFVNGVIAQLFAVSPGQINFLIPASILPGTATVVVNGRNGIVSRGTVTVNRTISAIFTARRDGTGAPAALASANGTTFNINMGNLDGTPNAIDAGNFVMMFATGLRSFSTPTSLLIDNFIVIPSFAGAHGTFVGQDQVNFQIPLALAGRGDVILLLFVDGQQSNPVLLRIR